MGGADPGEELVDGAIRVQRRQLVGRLLDELDGDLHASMAPVSLAFADFPVDAVLPGAFVELLGSEAALWVRSYT